MQRSLTIRSWGAWQAAKEAFVVVLSLMQSCWDQQCSCSSRTPENKGRWNTSLILNLPCDPKKAGHLVVDRGHIWCGTAAIFNQLCWICSLVSTQPRWIFYWKPGEQFDHYNINDVTGLMHLTKLAFINRIMHSFDHSYERSKSLKLITLHCNSPL